MTETKDGRYSVAWDQFLIGKRTMLAEYQQAREHSRNLQVQTWHGVVAEAIFRSWLENFLPKRFGVTSGYIRGQLLHTPYDYAHFDVIVYDQLNSPILWIDMSKDRSESGRARIIPAEYVYAVLEVKANLTYESVSAAAMKLRQLEPLMEAVDPLDERYPTYLPANAMVGMVFFELRRDAANDRRPLEVIRDLVTLPRTHYGAVILSGEGRHLDDTGVIQPKVTPEPFEGLYPEAGLLSVFCYSQTRQLGSQYFLTALLWSDIGFSDFAFDLLALLNGTYRSGYGSSFHGIDFGKF